MTKKNIMPAVVLSAICITVALLLALVNMITAPLIKAAQNAATNAALTVVLPGGKDFTEIAIDEKYPSVITKGYKADIGFVFQATVTGKSSGLIILCGIDTDGKIVGTKVIADQETDDYDKNVFPLLEGTNGKYTGVTLTDFEAQLVSGATLTSGAYSDAVKASLQAFVIANGGEVDVRTPEQILQDNCNTALGTTKVTFTRWLATEVLDGIDAVYEAADNSGRVFVIGESFIGVKADGTVLNLGNADESKITAANETVKNSTPVEITALPDGIDTAIIQKVSVTASGNYVFELKAKGYQAGFKYGDKTPIVIKLSISADGKIIDCVTVSHNESKGYGEICGSEEYSSQYKGADSGDVVISVESPSDHKDQIPDNTTDLGAISSATYTTVGYQKAVKAAFNAFELLTADGGAGNE